jgi:hypothetical protein
MLTRFARLAVTGCGCAVAGLLVAGCSSAGSSSPGPGSTTSSSPAASAIAASAAATTAATPAPGEAIVRSMVGENRGADHFGWVFASAKDVLATYYPPGSKNYIGGEHVDPADRIIVIKMHGLFDHSAPPGGKSTSTMLLRFYNATTGKGMGFSQMWDGDAPDLGVGSDPGIADRAAAAGRWDLRLLGTPVVRDA